MDLIFVSFGDVWCSVCKDLEYILKEIEKKDITVYRINIAENTDLLDKYSIEDIPTVVVFRKGKIAAHIPGLRRKEYYFKFI